MAGKFRLGPKVTKTQGNPNSYREHFSRTRQNGAALMKAFKNNKPLE
jgi:hypothetical protein